MGKFIQLISDGLYGTFKFCTCPPRTVSSRTDSLFSFASKHNVKSPGGVFADDGLVLTHLTNYAPTRNGFIDTVRSAMGMPRDSVHFSVNHGVAPHICAWNDKKYAVIMPMESALKCKENTFVGGTATDFYSRGRVKIPKGSVIVRRNDKIPEGKYRIMDASLVRQFCSMRGVRVIETSEQDMKVAVDNILQKMGYQLRDTVDPYIWGKRLSSGIKEFGRFNKYLRTKGMSPMMHTYTPNGRTEQLLGYIFTRAKIGSGWTAEHTGETIVNAKEEVLKAIDNISKSAKENRLPLDFDLPLIRKIVAESKTPNEAIELITKKMGIKSPIVDVDIQEFLKQNVNEKEASLYATMRMLVDGEAFKVSERDTNKYIAKPNVQSYTNLSNGIVNYMNELFAIGAKFDKIS